MLKEEAEPGVTVTEAAVDPVGIGPDAVSKAAIRD
jgi:hypothetical protein